MPSKLLYPLFQWDPRNALTAIRGTFTTNMEFGNRPHIVDP